MSKKTLTWVMSALVLFTLVVAPTMALAVTAEQAFPGEFEQESGFVQKDLKTTVGGIINVIMGFLGVIAVIIILLGGFKWMTAAGNEEKVGEAKKLLLSGIIGLAIVLAAYSIARFVVESLITATT